MNENQQTSQSLAIEERKPDYKSDMPDWQLLFMVHYEYARCSRWMLERVNAIRAPDSISKPDVFPRSTILPIVRCLATKFPEFPLTPWEAIEPTRRQALLATIGFNEQNGLYPPPLPAWESWELFEWIVRQHDEAPSDFASENYGVFKVDFTQENSVIKCQFSRWLEERRTFLLKKYDRPGEAASVTRERLLSFTERPYKRKRGGASLPAKYRLPLTALGHLRTYVHTQRDVAAANRLGEVKEVSSWDKYEMFAGRMLQSLESAWHCSATVWDVFEQNQYQHMVGCSGLRAPPQALDDPRSGMTKDMRKFLDEHFTLAILRCG